MTNVDKQYIDILRKIFDTGVEKETRAGKTKSIFGEQIKIDLKEGFPLLTTKKVFYKGVFHELLWFLKGETNIKYLVENGVNIWNDDAYRYFKTIYADSNISKEEFLKNVINSEKTGNYVFGDLGPVYGKQWRSFGYNGKDQIMEIIEKLKTNPNDRRMLCIAYNPDKIDEMALPPCHVMFQFYTRKLNDGKIGLSCMWVQRSCDFPLGVPFNIASYALLTHIIAKLVGMVPDMLIGSLGDCHIYENQIDGVVEQLNRKGYNELPQLIIHGSQNSIDDFKFDDLEIKNYKSDKSIKFPLSVG